MASIAEAIDSDGFYVDTGVEANLTDTDWEGIQTAVANGIAFVSFDQTADGDENGQAIATNLASLSSNYDSVVVLFSDGVYSHGPDKLNQAVSRQTTIDDFRGGNVGQGLTSIVDFVGGDIPAGDTTDQTTAPADASAPASSSETPQATSSDSSGGGIPWLWLILAAVATFFFVRWRSAKAKAKKLLTADMETDRAEIKEQLKDNADQVITLGDSVIASRDQELIDLYDKASRTYQEVSQSVDEASTPEAVDALDDRIDEAEWELEVIQARLNGTPIPTSPAVLEAQEAAKNAPPPPSAGPALGPNDSVLGGSGPTRQARRERSYKPRRQPGRASTRRGGGMGTSILMMLATFLFNSYGKSSRRTERRDATSSSSQPRGGPLGGSVLGGAPRRGGRR